MIVTVDDGVFDEEEGYDALLLYPLLVFGFYGRHRILTDPLFEPDAGRAVNRWLERQDELTADIVEEIFETGIRSEAQGPTTSCEVRVEAWEASDRASDIPRLTLEDAYQLLRRPLKILVEDRISDGAFIRHVCRHARSKLLREHLERAFAQEFAVFEHGGGNSSMIRFVENADGEEWLPWRLFILFDSDAKEPGAPSEQAERLRESCGTSGVSYHQLARRMIENYLPPQALGGWVSEQPTNIKAEARRVKDIFAGELGAEQRAHYHLKKGLSADADSIEELSPFWRDLSPRTMDILWEGFPKAATLAERFRPGGHAFPSKWLERDGQLEELHDIADAIHEVL